MKVGDLVIIYYGEPDGFLVDTNGLILASYGYKCEVLVESEIQMWDYNDLVEMRKDKHESR